MRTRLLITLLFFLAATADAAALLPSGLTLVKAARLLDPRTGTVLAPAAVLVEGEKIIAVGSPAQIENHVPAPDRTIDLGAATLLPGLIDSHTHLLLDVVVPPEIEIGRRLKHPMRIDGFGESRHLNTCSKNTPTDAVPVFVPVCGVLSVI